MRLIATHPDETEARRFVDYLLTREIAAQIQGTPEGWQLWVIREDQVAAAREAYAKYIEDPTNSEFQGHAIRARAIREAAERTRRAHEANTYNVNQIWTARDFRRCPVTWALVALSLLITFATSFGTNPRLTEIFLVARYKTVNPQQIDPEQATDVYEYRDRLIQTDLRSDLARGEFWRLITPIFLHFNWPHLLFDMYILLALGTEIEVRRRSWWLGLFVLGAAIVTNLGQYLITHYPLFGGMSGVDMALFGYVWIKGMYEPELGLNLARSTVVLLLVYLTYTYLSRMDMAHSAHLTGLAYGILVALVPHLRESLFPASDD